VFFVNYIEKGLRGDLRSGSNEAISHLWERISNEFPGRKKELAELLNKEIKKLTRDPKYKDAFNAYSPLNGWEHVHIPLLPTS
jgi:hypothetical protein